MIPVHTLFGTDDTEDEAAQLSLKPSIEVKSVSTVVLDIVGKGNDEFVESFVKEPNKSISLAVCGAANQNKKASISGYVYGKEKCKET